MASLGTGAFELCHDDGALPTIDEEYRADGMRLSDQDGDGIIEVARHKAQRSAAIDAYKVDTGP